MRHTLIAGLLALGSLLGSAPAGAEPPLTIALIGGPQFGVPTGKPLVFVVESARAASVFCYYEYPVKGGRRLVRVFPNRWQTENRLAPGARVVVPNGTAEFDITPRMALSLERIGCIAKEGGYRHDRVPALVKRHDLRALPVHSIEAAFEQHLRADPGMTETAILTLQIR